MTDETYLTSDLTAGKWYLVNTSNEENPVKEYDSLEEAMTGRLKFFGSNEVSIPELPQWRKKEADKGRIKLK